MKYEIGDLVLWYEDNSKKKVTAVGLIIRIDEDDLIQVHWSDPAHQTFDEAWLDKRIELGWCNVLPKKSRASLNSK